MSSPFNDSEFRERFDHLMEQDSWGHIGRIFVLTLPEEDMPIRFHMWSHVWWQDVFYLVWGKDLRQGIEDAVSDALEGLFVRRDIPMI